jgi:magnesium chelatase subunit D
MRLAAPAADPSGGDKAVDVARQRWADAATVAALIWVDPHGLGGVHLHASAGPVRTRWIELLQSLRPEGLALRRMPLAIADERLLGGIDLAATLAAGRPIAQRGLLVESDGGLVMAAMAERMSSGTAARLAAVLDRGEVALERDGLTAVHAGRVGIVALDESAEDEDGPPRALTERLAFHLSLDEVPVRVATDEPFPAADVRQARARLASMTLSDALLEAICAAAHALGVASARATLLALRVARASAALRGRDAADADDAQLAVRLVLAPRATQWPTPPRETAPEDSPPDTPPPPQEPLQESASQDDDPTAEPQTLEDQLIEAAVAALPASLLAQLKSGMSQPQRNANAGRVGQLIASARHGRPVGVRRGKPADGLRLDLIETLRAAVPWQRLRRALPGATGRIAVRAEDFHIKRFEQRNRSTTLFVIDASGSAALHRLAEAKGAVELLLADCYVRRDEVGVIAFRGHSAELLLPPTRSLVRAKRSLAGLPGGGGTPLAAGIGAAATLADQVRRSGSTPVIVFLTDGRANIARDGTPGRERADEDARQAARGLRSARVATLVVDTSARSEPAARRLAEDLGATYLALPYAAAQTLSRAVRALPNPGHA